MRRWMILLPFALAGCSTHPIADFLDIVKPAPPLGPVANPVEPCLPSYPSGAVAPPLTNLPANGPAIPPPPPAWPGP
jgi:hypothetical protein